EGPLRGPSLLSSVKGLEVVKLGVVGEPLSEQRSLLVGGAEVDSGPDASFDQLAEHIGEPVEGAPLAGEPAARDVEAQVVRPEERLQRVHARARVAEMPGWMLRERRRDQRRAGAGDGWGPRWHG